MSASTEEFERVNEVGPRISQSIREFFDEERNRVAHREAPRCRAHTSCSDRSHLAASDSGASGIMLQPAQALSLSDQR
jgi:hypothetical protein